MMVAAKWSTEVTGGNGGGGNGSESYEVAMVTKAILLCLQKKLKEECFSSLSKNYEAAEEPLPPSRHPQCFLRSTGPQACVLTYVRLCFSG